MAVMGMLGVTMAYVMRACLSLTLTQMVLPVVIADGGLQTAVARHEYCPAPSNVHKRSAANDTESYSDDDGVGVGQFDWDERTQGQVLSAFYYGYILTHLPGGVLSQRFGGKHTMGLGILSTALFTLLTPHVAYMGPAHLTVLRFVEGLGEVRCPVCPYAIKPLSSLRVFRAGHDVPGALHAARPVGASRGKGKTVHGGVRG